MLPEIKEVENRMIWIEYLIKKYNTKDYVSESLTKFNTEARKFLRDNPEGARISYRLQERFNILAKNVRDYSGEMVYLIED